MAPMSLLDYKSARPWAKAIQTAVVTQKMPPWFADPRYGHFENDARLKASDIETIKAWVAGGAVEGNAKDLPPQPTFAEGWLGSPMRYRYREDHGAGGRDLYGLHRSDQFQRASGSGRPGAAGIARWCTMATSVCWLMRMRRRKMLAL
jgi:hypothetical protein